MRIALIVLVLSACVAPSPPQEDLDLRGHSATLLDDGSMLHVTGCLSGLVLGGCQPLQAGDGMAVTVDGAVHFVPFHPEAPPHDPNEIIIFDDGGNRFRLDLPSPVDVHIGIGLAHEAAHVELPQRFAITPPPDHVSRSTETLTIEHEVLPGARIGVAVVVTCGDQTFQENPVEATPGQAQIVLTALGNGTCTHDVSITQVTPFPTGVVLEGSTGRTETVRITSDP